MEILVVGCGRVGRDIAWDLHGEGEFVVTVADLDPERLKSFGGSRLALNAADPRAVQRAVENFDLVVGAVPGHLGYNLVHAVLNAGKPIVDISFFPENPAPLRGFAEFSGVVCAIDCGVAPGLWNMLLAHVEKTHTVTSAKCYVGGLPVERRWPWQYKAGFNPRDVLEEYTRPARYLVNGKVVTKPALSEPEMVHIPGLGTLEAFNTDGLRTLLTGETVRCKNLIERTLRYPGHAELMRVLQHAGFFSKEPVRPHGWEGVELRPVDLTSHLLFPQWEMTEDDQDLTVMRIEMEIDGEIKTWTMIDHADDAATSMSRTTGYTATSVVRAIASGLITEPGLYPPEAIGACCYPEIDQWLQEREVDLSAD